MFFQEYFQSYDNYFWEWDNESHSAESIFEAIVIPQGTTIAYEAYVMETLELLSEDGLPPFGSLLLALVATKNVNGDEALNTVFEIINQTRTVTKEREYPKTFEYARKFLDTLASLPDEFKQGNKRKEVLQFIFKDCHNRLSSERAKTIMGHYSEKPGFLRNCAMKIPLSEANLNKDFKTLAHLNVKYTGRDALLAALTGIDKLPELNDETVEQQPVPAPAGNFVDELINEPKTFQVGSLIQRIWGGLNIPLHHSEPSHQPLGGISDLTNKGDFDKLLISEFANDDEVFMSRIANNEALYIKREVPPESHKFVRLLLVDCSVKNWGTPKILAFASALAIARHPKTDIECRIIAIGNDFKEVPCDTVTDIIDALGSIGSKLDAAPALEQVLNDNVDIKHSEVFLISSEDALCSPNMQRVLSDNHEKIKYIITAEAEGSINFFRMQNRGRKLIQHIFLPLNELWAKRPAGRVVKKQSILSDRGDTMPNVYPILCSPPKKRMEIFLLNKNEYYILTNSGSLYLVEDNKPKDANSYYRQHKGSELILHNLSIKQGGKYALNLNEHGEFILTAFYKRAMLLSMLNLHTRDYCKTKLELKGDADKYVVFDDNGFHLFNESEKIFYKAELLQGKIMLNETDFKAGTVKEYNDNKKKIEDFNKSLIDNDVLLNFLPLSITKGKKIQLNKHSLDIDVTNHYKSIRLNGHSSYVPAREAVYDKMHKRFVFTDGSSICRENVGMMILKSSNPDIPFIYIPTSLNVELAMATDEAFTGNNSFFKGDAGQRVISMEEFNVRYIEPFINTILNHGT